MPKAAVESRSEYSRRLMSKGTATLEIEIVKPFNIQHDGEVLQWGQRYTLPENVGRQYIAEGRAIAPGEPRQVPHSDAAQDERDAQKRFVGAVVFFRVRLRPGVHIDAGNGVVYGPGEEHEIPGHWTCGRGDPRFDWLDSPPHAEPSLPPIMNPHPIRVGGPCLQAPGLVYSASLRRDLAIGEEVVVEDAEALSLISFRRATSTKPEQSDPVAEELANLIGGDDPEKRAQAAKLTRLLGRRGA